MPATRLKGLEDWVVESDHYRYYRRDTDFPVHVEQDNEFIFPGHLQVNFRYRCVGYEIVIQHSSNEKWLCTFCKLSWGFM